jgi:hypothetical protein
MSCVKPEMESWMTHSFGTPSVLLQSFFASPSDLLLRISFTSPWVTKYSKILPSDLLGQTKSFIKNSDTCRVMNFWGWITTINTIWAYISFGTPSHLIGISLVSPSVLLLFSFTNPSVWNWYYAQQIVEGDGLSHDAWNKPNDPGEIK